MFRKENRIQLRKCLLRIGNTCTWMVKGVANTSLKKITNIYYFDKHLFICILTIIILLNKMNLVNKSSRTSKQKKSIPSWEKHNWRVKFFVNKIVPFLLRDCWNIIIFLYYFRVINLKPIEVRKTKIISKDSITHF